MFNADIRSWLDDERAQQKKKEGEEEEVEWNGFNRNTYALHLLIDSSLFDSLDNDIPVRRNEFRNEILIPFLGSRNGTETMHDSSFHSINLLRSFWILYDFRLRRIKQYSTGERLAI